MSEQINKAKAKFMENLQEVARARKAPKVNKPSKQSGGFGKVVKAGLGAAALGGAAIAGGLVGHHLGKSASNPGGTAKAGIRNPTYTVPKGSYKVY